MPIQSACKLLHTDCDKLETCSVVNETTGETSCIDVGPRGIDEECETDHCAANLVCLGGAGWRNPTASARSTTASARWVRFAAPIRRPSRGKTKSASARSSADRERVPGQAPRCLGQGGDAASLDFVGVWAWHDRC